MYMCHNYACTCTLLENPSNAVSCDIDHCTWRNVSQCEYCVCTCLCMQAEAYRAIAREVLKRLPSGSEIDSFQPR